MKYDLEKCNNLQFKVKDRRGDEREGYLKITSGGKVYVYYSDENKIFNPFLQIELNFHHEIFEATNFREWAENNELEIIPRNPETYTDWKVGDKVISNTGNKVNTIIAVLGKAIVLVRDAEVPITTLTSADDLTKYNKLVLTDYEKELIHAQEPEKKKNGPFKNGDRVLARDNDDAPWQYDIFYFYEEESSLPYCCETGQYQQCIPLNDHTWQLLGTTDEYKEEE